MDLLLSNEVKLKSFEDAFNGFLCNTGYFLLTPETFQKHGEIPIEQNAAKFQSDRKPHGRQDSALNRQEQKHTVKPVQHQRFRPPQKWSQPPGGLYRPRLSQCRSESEGGSMCRMGNPASPPASRRQIPEKFRKKNNALSKYSYSGKE